MRGHQQLLGLAALATSIAVPSYAPQAKEVQTAKTAHSLPTRKDIRILDGGFAIVSATRPVLNAVRAATIPVGAAVWIDEALLALPVLQYGRLQP